MVPTRYGRQAEKGNVYHADDTLHRIRQLIRDIIDQNPLGVIWSSLTDH